MTTLFFLVFSIITSLNVSQAEARYLQADPLGLVDGASVYGYALQNPQRYTDPRGEQSQIGPEFPFNPNTGLPGFDYDPRVLPGSRADPNHNFPTSFDDEILASGQLCGCGITGEGFYTQYGVGGMLNGTRGTYEVGIVSNPFNGQPPKVVHRFFRPGPPRSACLPFMPKFPQY
jgi:hypothetical protein